MIGVSKQTLYRWRSEYAGWKHRPRPETPHATADRNTLACSESWSACRGKTKVYSRWRRASFSARRVARNCVERVRAVFGVSERRACRVLGQHRSTQRYQPTTVSKPSDHSRQAATTPSQTNA